VHNCLGRTIFSFVAQADVRSRVFFLFPSSEHWRQTSADDDDDDDVALDLSMKTAAALEEVGCRKRVSSSSLASSGAESEDGGLEPTVPQSKCRKLRFDDGQTSAASTFRKHLVADGDDDFPEIHRGEATFC
jgi:hypothetical protein